MYDPNDDTDVTSGLRDDAKMETTSPPRYMVISNGLPALSYYTQHLKIRNTKSASSQVFLS